MPPDHPSRAQVGGSSLHRSWACYRYGAAAYGEAHQAGCGCHPGTVTCSDGYGDLRRCSCVVWSGPGYKAPEGCSCELAVIREDVQMSHTSTALSSGGAAAIGGTTVPPATPVDSFSEQLAERLGKHSALPYLFVGSGLSRRYLGLPDWRGMLMTFADDLSVNFDYLLASADGDLPQAAGLLAAAFHEPWWQDARYKTQRELHASDVKDKEGALKVAVAEYFRERSPLQAGSPGVDDGGLALEIATLRDAVIDGIVTTNYDNLTDEVFPEFKDYVGQDDLILSDAQFVAEVYKIHGSCEKPASLVLTKRDYEQYHQRNAYLAAKLLTIFAEHPVIFLGYSLGDGYIREIIENIAMAVGPSRLDRLQSQIYFVEWNPNPQVLPSLSPFFIDLHQQGHSLPAMRIETSTYLPIFQALTALQRPFPIQVLRQLKEHVYNLVSHPDPDQALESVRAIPFDSAETGDYRVVFGVGSFTDQDLQDISGLSGRVLTRLDLARDLLGIRERRIVAKNGLILRTSRDT